MLSRLNVFKIDVMLKKNLQINCILIYHDLHVYDTMTILQKMNKK